MFGDGDGLNSEIKFAVAAAYDAFSKSWGDLPSEKIFWVDRWSSLLNRFDVRTIGHATEYCVQSLTRAHFARVPNLLPKNKKQGTFNRSNNFKSGRNC
jgi:hypothetical protein